jgi:glycerophosphoryl diester phosphodiesterase
MGKAPLIISHRGNGSHAVENTINACALALENGAQALEIDIRQCATGEIVVFHDFSLKRMFAKGGYIGRTSLDLLKSFTYTNTNDHIDTLDEFFETFKNRVPINLDAKTIHFFDFKFADKIISIIANHDLFDTVWISCFNPFLLQLLKMNSKKIKTGYLFQRLSWLHTGYDRITWSDAWHPHFSIVNEYLVRKAQNNKKNLYVWTVNKQSVYDKIKNFPIAGIITDDVKTMKGIVNEG